MDFDRQAWTALICCGKGLCKKNDTKSQKVLSGACSFRGPCVYYDSFGLGIVIGNPLRFGSVNFENCSPEQLRLFRLIPEKGKKLSIPINGKNPKIDGVWVKGNRNWLKIPNHCYATITCEEKCKSSYKYTIYCNLAISLIKGTGGFVPDAGSTTHGTDYPF